MVCGGHRKMENNLDVVSTQPLLLNQPRAQCAGYDSSNHAQCNMSCKSELGNSGSGALWCEDDNDLSDVEKWVKNLDTTAS